MQVKVVTSVVAGQETVATKAVQAFIDALSEQLGEDYTFSLDTDYGESLTQGDSDVYLVYFGSQANLTAAQKAKMIIFYSDEDVDNLQIGRFVDMLKQLNPQK
jgi:ABC-type phosphate/phosphonate transport system substrate-binding protein